MYAHAVCDMSSKSIACISALVIISLWDAALDSRDCLKSWSVYSVQELSEYYLLNKMYIMARNDGHH